MMRMEKTGNIKKDETNLKKRMRTRARTRTGTSTRTEARAKKRTSRFRQHRCGRRQAKKAAPPSRKTKGKVS